MGANNRSWKTESMPADDSESVIFGTRLILVTITVCSCVPLPGKRAGRDSSASFQNNDCGVPELASGQGVGQLEAENLR